MRKNKYINFAKMHGLGNDFIVLDGTNEEFSDVHALAVKLCDRHTGIGADGLLLVENSDVAHVRMRIINSDGSEANMCGNGLRCFSRFVYEQGIVREPAFDVETFAGIVHPLIILDNGRVSAVRVNMGQPVFIASDIPAICCGNTFVSGDISALDRHFRATAVLMGVPHLIIVTEQCVTHEELCRYGAALEKHEMFPQGINVDFVCVKNGCLYVKTWERGCGATLACGTGACASVVACREGGHIDGDEAVVQLALGTLHIKIELSGDVHMTGPAVKVFTGQYE